MTIRIRRAAEADAPVLADLATQLGYPSTAAAMAARLRTVRPREDAHRFDLRSGNRRLKRQAIFTKDL